MKSTPHPFVGNPIKLSNLLTFAVIGLAISAFSGAGEAFAQQTPGGTPDGREDAAGRTKKCKSKSIRGSGDGDCGSSDTTCQGSACRDEAKGEACDDYNRKCKQYCESQDINSTTHKCYQKRGNACGSGTGTVADCTGGIVRAYVKKTCQCEKKRIPTRVPDIAENSNPVSAGTPSGPATSGGTAQPSGGTSGR